MVNELKFPKYKHTASGRIYTCIGFTVDLRSTWEWYAFEDEETVFTLVMLWDLKRVRKFL